MSLTKKELIEKNLYELEISVDHDTFEAAVNREVGRLRLSLEQAKKLQDPAVPRETLVFLHFPPVFGGFECREIIDILHEYRIRHCYYGHIHSSYRIPRTVDYEGIELTLVSSDFLNFIPMIIFPDTDGNDC